MRAGRCECLTGSPRPNSRPAVHEQLTGPSGVRSATAGAMAAGSIVTVEGDASQHSSESSSSNEARRQHDHDTAADRFGLPRSAKRPEMDSRPGRSPTAVGCRSHEEAPGKSSGLTSAIDAGVTRDAESNRRCEAVGVHRLRPGRSRQRTTSSSAPRERVQPAERRRHSPAPRGMKVGNLPLEFRGFPGQPFVLLFQRRESARTRSDLPDDGGKFFASSPKGRLQRQESDRAR